MKILFDQGTPVPLRRHLPRHDVATAAEMDWSQLTNGELLAAATEAGFEVLVTTDRNLRYQQNLTDRKIAVVVLMTASWPRISKQADKVAAAI
jgi:predicted nuclease of predicted toxin-antitoxin system